VSPRNIACSSLLLAMCLSKPQMSVVLAVLTCWFSHSFSSV